MRSLVLSSLLCAAAVSATWLPAMPSRLDRREEFQVCTDLKVSANNGDRKVAIVIDTSGSMSSNDRGNLRLQTGRALNDFLISGAEATGEKKVDKVTVIEFSDKAKLAYGLGDPANIGSAFNMSASGGTLISSGVTMAIDQITSIDSTDKRSAIVVFTDGEDSNVAALTAAINKASGLGIRVSFGFIDTSAGSQRAEILKAVRDSRGVYATITQADGSQNFLNYVLLNGLTYNDNPQGYNSQLFAGLSETHLISGSSSVSLKYRAAKDERVTFSVVGISSGVLSTEVKLGGSSLQTTSTAATRNSLTVVSPDTGTMDVIVTARNAAADSLFSVSTTSNQGIKNCTVGVEEAQQGLSTGAKAGVGVGVVAALALLGTAGYFAYQHFHTPTPTGNEFAAPPGDGGFTPGAEKMAMQSTVTPMDANGQLPMNANGQMPMNPNGFNGPMYPGGPPPGPTGAEGQFMMNAPPGGPTGAEGQFMMNAPPGGPTGAEGQMMMNAPPSGPTPTGPVGGAAPAFFIPPLLPPVLPRGQQPTPSNNSDRDSNAPHSPPPQSNSPFSFAQSPYTPPPNGPMVPPGTQNALPGSGPNGYPGQPMYNAGQQPMYNASQAPMYNPGQAPMSPNAQGPLYNAPPGQQLMYAPPGADQQPLYHAANQPLHPTAPPTTGGAELGSPPCGPTEVAPPTGPTQVAPPTGPTPDAGGGPQAYVPTAPNMPFGAVAGVNKREKHHHHPWIARPEVCLNRECPFNMVGHQCGERCECECREGDCPLNK